MFEEREKFRPMKIIGRKYFPLNVNENKLERTFIRKKILKKLCESDERPNDFT